MRSRIPMSLALPSELYTSNISAGGFDQWLSRLHLQQHLCEQSRSHSEEIAEDQDRHRTNQGLRGNFHRQICENQKVIVVADASFTRHAEEGETLL